jgi:hypothetical protein
MGLEVGRFIISVARHDKAAEYDFLYVSHNIKHLKIVVSVHEEDMALSILRKIRQIH